MRTLILLLVVIVLASAKIQRKGAKLCTFCESFVSGIELGLESEEKDLEKLANSLCDTLCKDKALDNICRGLIDNELESIVNWLLTNENAVTVCKQIHLC